MSEMIDVSKEDYEKLLKMKSFIHSINSYIKSMDDIYNEEEGIQEGDPNYIEREVEEWPEDPASYIFEMGLEMQMYSQYFADQSFIIDEFYERIEKVN